MCSLPCLRTQKFRPEFFISRISCLIIITISLSLHAGIEWFQLIDDKKNLSEKCEKLVTELKTVDKKYQEKMKTLEGR